MRSDFTTDLELQHGPAQVLLQHEPVGGHPGARGHRLLLRLTRVYSDEDLDLETQPETNQLMKGRALAAWQHCAGKSNQHSTLFSSRSFL